MEIYSNPLYVTRVAGPGTNISIEENEGYEVFCNNVTKSSTKDKDKIQKLLTNLRPKPVFSSTWCHSVKALVQTLIQVTGNYWPHEPATYRMNEVLIRIIR